MREETITDLLNWKFYRNIYSESVLLLILFFTTVFSVYFLPKIASVSLVVLISGLFLNSKKDYFWVVFFFILYSKPAGFFSAEAIDAPFRLPLFTIFKGISFSTTDIFIVLMFVKALTIKKRFQYIISKPINLIIIYGILLFVLSFTLYGTSIPFVLSLFRKAFYFSLFFSFPILVYKREDNYKFIYLLFPLLFISFLTTIYFFLTGSYFVDLFDPGSMRDMRMTTHDGQIVKRFGAIISDQYIYLTFIFSLSLLYIQNISKQKTLVLYLIAVLSYLHIVFSATRAWFVIYSIVFFYFFYRKGVKIRSLIVIGFIGVLLVGMFVNSDIARTQLGGTMDRLFSVFDLGEESSNSTISVESRILYDVPLALEGIRKNPVLGWGFSENYIKYANSDTGNFALLVQVGYTGFLLFLYFWISYFSSMINAKRNLSPQNPFINILNVFIIGFVGLLMSHFMTTQIFGLHIRPFLVVLYVYFSDFFIRESLRYEKQLTR